MDSGRGERAVGSSACRGASSEPVAAGAWRPPWGLQPEGLGTVWWLRQQGWNLRRARAEGVEGDSQGGPGLSWSGRHVQ